MYIRYENKKSVEPRSQNAALSLLFLFLLCVRKSSLLFLGIVVRARFYPAFFFCRRRLATTLHMFLCLFISLCIASAKNMDMENLHLILFPLLLKGNSNGSLMLLLLKTTLANWQAFWVDPLVDNIISELTWQKPSYLDWDVLFSNCYNIMTYFRFQKSTCWRKGEMNEKVYPTRSNFRDSATGVKTQCKRRKFMHQRNWSLLAELDPHRRRR